MTIQFTDLKQQYALIETKVSERIRSVLSHGQYILGPEVAELEKKLSAFTGAPHCIGAANGTDALLAALMALDVGHGDEVIVPDFTFVAPAEVVCLIGAKPVFVDIDPDHFLINPDLLEKAITSKTKAIIAVSLYGQCANFESINKIAQHHGIPVIEDAAQSFGAVRNGKSSCNMTTIATTSFFPSKPLGCYGDGGAIFCSDEALAKRIRQIIQHGQEKRYHYTSVGFNGRLDTIQAAILLAKFEIFADEIPKRDAVAMSYSRLIQEKCKSVVTPALLPGNKSVYAQYTIRVKNRDNVKAFLDSKGIPTAIHYPFSLGKQPAYQDFYRNCPESEHAATEVLSLPMHPYLLSGDQEVIVSALSASIK